MDASGQVSEEIMDIEARLIRDVDFPPHVALSACQAHPDDANACMKALNQWQNDNPGVDWDQGGDSAWEGDHAGAVKMFKKVKKMNAKQAV